MTDVVSRALERLPAPGAAAPNPAPYEPLLGAWDVEWCTLDEQGRAGHRIRGEWHFTRILGGNGVQDVIWATGSAPESAGTTLRCWDSAQGVWRAVFMSPADGEFVSLIGRPAPDGIRQQVVDPVTRPGVREWNFSRIEGSSFRWQARTSEDGGGTWRTTHEIWARRQR